jgi:hypothetical protein
VALLSVGEIVAPDDRSVRLALWPGTTATRNLTRTGMGTLAYFGDGGALYVRIRVGRGPDIVAMGIGHAYFEGRLVQVLEDKVTYARLVHGIVFDLPDPTGTMRRWRATIDAMRLAPSAFPAAQ